MNTATYSYARQNLTALMSAVCKNNEQVVIASPKNKVVMMSLDDFNAIMETCYLLSNPANAEHIRTGIKQIERGKVYDEKDLGL